MEFNLGVLQTRGKDDAEWSSVPAMGGSTFDESEINATTNTLFNTFAEIGVVERTQEGTGAQTFTLTLSEPITNFVMIYAAVMAITQTPTKLYSYTLGSSFVPVSFFQLGNILELNAINDVGDLYGGNMEYVDDTTVTGKIVGRTTHMKIFGIARVAE